MSYIVWVILKLSKSGSRVSGSKAAGWSDISPVCPRKRLPLTASYKQSRSLSALQAAELCINFHPSFIPKYNFHELGNKIKIQQKLNEISVLMQ